MLLKRSIVLTAGILLSIAAIIIYFDVSHAQMESVFQSEREKFHADPIVLTTATPFPAAAMPASNSGTATDASTLIGPVPAANSSAPDGTQAPISPATDTNSAPAPAPPVAPDTNPAPAAPSSPSTMDERRENRPPFFELTSYRPSDGTEIDVIGAFAAATNSPTSPAIGSATNAASFPIPPVATRETVSPAAPAPSTNNSGGVRPASPEGKVIVLLYHQFRAAGVSIPAPYIYTMHQDVFESEMKYIHDNGYQVIPMSDLIRFLRHEITVPPNSVCLTIDDGYKSAIVYAAPILKKYGYPWTFFIYPEFITTGEGPGAASWKDLLELQADGVDIESHSMTHPHLTKKAGKTPEQYAAWLTKEIAGSKAVLEQKMGKSIPCFAYPYGEYNKQVEDVAIAAGYEAIFTVADNPVHASTNLHSVGRYTMTRDVEKNFAAYLRQGALGIDAADPAPGAIITDPRPVITATLGYAGTLDPKSIETSVRDFGIVRHDFDPRTNIVRLYLSRDLVQPVNVVNIRVEDAATKKVMVANWHFNYEPAAVASPGTHPAIAPASPAASSQSPTPASAPATQAREPNGVDPPAVPKSAAVTPVESPAPPLH